MYLWIWIFTHGIHLNPSIWKYFVVYYSLHHFDVMLKRELLLNIVCASFALYYSGWLGRWLPAKPDRVWKLVRVVKFAKFPMSISRGGVAAPAVAVSSPSLRAVIIARNEKARKRIHPAPHYAKTGSWENRENVQSLARHCSCSRRAKNKKKKYTKAEGVEQNERKSNLTPSELWTSHYIIIIRVRPSSCEQKSTRSAMRM